MSSTRNASASFSSFRTPFAPSDARSPHNDSNRWRSKRDERTDAVQDVQADQRGDVRLLYQVDRGVDAESVECRRHRSVAYGEIVPVPSVAEVVDRLVRPHGPVVVTVNERRRHVVRAAIDHHDDADWPVPDLFVPCPRLEQGPPASRRRHVVLHALVAEETDDLANQSPRRAERSPRPSGRGVRHDQHLSGFLDDGQPTPTAGRVVVAQPAPTLQSALDARLPLLSHVVVDTAVRQPHSIWGHGWLVAGNPPRSFKPAGVDADRGTRPVTRRMPGRPRRWSSRPDPGRRHPPGTRREIEARGRTGRRLRGRWQGRRG